MFFNSMAISTAAGLCTAMGALVVLITGRLGPRGMSFYMGLASGVMVAVVALDLIPSALVIGEGFSFVLGAFSGWAVVVMTMVLTRTEAGEEVGLARIGYMIMLGIAVHDLPEGMAIALGSEIGARTAAVIAIGIAIHNMPEGMVIAAPLSRAGKPASQVLLFTGLVGLVTPAGTLLGHLAVAALPQYFGMLLGIAAGIMAGLVFHQLWPEARRNRSGWRWIGLASGWVVIAVATFL